MGGHLPNCSHLWIALVITPTLLGIYQLSRHDPCCPFPPKKEKITPHGFGHLAVRSVVYHFPPFFLHMQQQSKIMSRHLRLSMVSIFPKEAVQTKKAAFRGAWVFHIFLHRKAFMPWLVKFWSNHLTMNLHSLEGLQRILSVVPLPFCIMPFHMILSQVCHGIAVVIK